MFFLGSARKPEDSYIYKKKGHDHDKDMQGPTSTFSKLLVPCKQRILYTTSKSVLNVHMKHAHKYV